MNLSQIDTGIIEGRLLIAALSVLSVESRTHQEPDEILYDIIVLQSEIYKDNPLPKCQPPQ